MRGQPMILRLVHTITCASSLQEAEAAFAALCGADLAAAKCMAGVLAVALPQSAPLWKAILEQAEQGPEHVDRQSGPALAECDAVDTARDLAAHMGWRRGEPSA